MNQTQDWFGYDILLNYAFQNFPFVLSHEWICKHNCIRWKSALLEGYVYGSDFVINDWKMTTPYEGEMQCSTTHLIKGG